MGDDPLTSSQLNDVQLLECYADFWEGGGQYIEEIEFVEDEAKRDPRIKGIVPMAPPTLRECLAAAAVWVAKCDDGPKRVAVPKNAVASIHARGQWQDVRTLEAVVDCPVLRPDGSVIETPGYDAATGILYAPSIEFPVVPEEPGIDEAKAAGLYD